MIFVFRSPRSTSALKLSQALEGQRVRTQGELNQVKPDDVVVYYGSRGRSAAKFQLNDAPVYNKLSELRILTEAGVRTVEFSQARKGEGWLGRTLGHQEGKDLLRPLAYADYWTRREEFVKEFRVHSFLGRSIRAGVKIPREGFEKPHPWVRSYDAGWRISYDGTSVKQKHRDIAHQATKAMGLDFAAVDIGERADGTVVVLEINRAPGLEGKTIPIYANAITAWLKEIQ